MRIQPSFVRERGVTLIEVAIVIAITAIIGAMIAFFIAPVRAYIDSSRRAALADTADISLRRIGRDVRLALPNSTRVTTTGAGPSTIYYLEFMLVRTGGRYRTDTDAGATSTCTGVAAEDALRFGTSDTCFKTIGAIPNLTQITTSDYVVVYNLQPGTANADAYETTGTGGNKSKITAKTLGVGANAGQDKIEFEANTFTYESPGNRFFIIEGPVSYICSPGAGTLTRRWGYTISSTQPTSFSDGSSALMASGVTKCSIAYESSLTSQGAGLVTLQLQVSANDSTGAQESANLYHAVHVNNVP